jgi:peptidoglycan-N-acetylglucosamine deacetylase
LFPQVDCSGSPQLGAGVNVLQKFVLRLLLAGTLALSSSASADQGTCRGTSRVVEVDTANGPKIGKFQYPGTLDLGLREVVLTFDDGPDPVLTPKVLDILDAYCVKATFFLVGKAAEAHPDLTLEIVRRGHTLGNHSWSHPRSLRRMPSAKGRLEIEQGFNAIYTASAGALAPFFRYPGLSESRSLNKFLQDRQFAIFSSDVNTDDWRKHIKAETIIKGTFQRLQQRGKGILLFHDDRPVLVEALPTILEGLKLRGYKVAHVVPKGPRLEPWASDRSVAQAPVDKPSVYSGSKATPVAHATPDALP